MTGRPDPAAELGAPPAGDVAAAAAECKARILEREGIAMFVALHVSICRLTHRSDWCRPISGRAYHPPSRREGYESR